MGPTPHLLVCPTDQRTRHALRARSLGDSGVSRGSLLAVADQDPELRQELSKEGRLWLLSLVCASAGAVTVWATDSLGQGVLAFLVSVAILGPLLWLYEKRRR
jgi:hypothetical protein